MSTRTIHNHFDAKANLFHGVIRASATRIADASVAILATSLDPDNNPVQLWARPNQIARSRVA